MYRETSIEGVVERIVYSNEETAWSVVRLLVRGKGEVTAVGRLIGVRPGENLRLQGEWVKDRKFGKQFRTESFLPVAPRTYTGMEKYLGSGLIPGIGKEYAKRLVQHFGLDTLEVIDKFPERLAEVEGIGRKRSRKIIEAWREQREIKDVMVFLQSHGVSTSHAVKIYKLYGRDATETVRSDPYRLAREIFGIGFQTADRIASSLGIEADAPQRVDAGTLHSLTQATEQGHTHLPRRQLVEQASELLGIQAEAVEGGIDRLTEAGDLTVEPVEPLFQGQEPSPDEAAVFPTSLAAAEKGVAQRLRSLAQHPGVPLRIDVARALRWYEDQEQISLARQQRSALERALTTKVLVITGGPGTGKTTLVKGIVRILTLKRQRLLLAAPTGRAAKRLSEATGQEAKTVHRLLEYSPLEHGFARGPDNPLSLDLLVIDEASMLDTSLTHHVLKALPPAARLILVGDVDQLPSIGPGRVLADIIESEAIEVVRLDEIFRQARQSLIVTNAHRIRGGQTPLTSPEESGDFFLVEREAPEAILATLKQVVAERIPRHLGLAPREEIQVLTPMRRGLLGTQNLNAELQALLNADGTSVPSGNRSLRLGDRVMQRRNNYDLEVWNGDIGRVEAHNEEEQQLQVNFDGRLVTYERSDFDELVLAYACSIHKSQGSEYPCVVIPLHTQHFTLLERNLLYTAVTRGRRMVMVIASRRALELAVKTTHAHRRRTRLAHRLAEFRMSERQTSPER